MSDSKKKLLILGGTGRTGRELVAQALARDYQVNAIVRDQSKLPSHNGISVFEGDVLDPALLASAMKDCSAVLSCLNISRTSDFPLAPLRTPKDFLENVLKLVMDQMANYQIDRLVLTSAWGVGDSRKELPFWFRWTIDFTNVGKAYDQHEVQERMLKNSKLHWTAIRPVGLTNSNRVKELIVSKEGNPKPRLMISRRQTAQFMLDVLEDEMYLRDTPVISEK